METLDLVGTVEIEFEGAEAKASGPRAGVTAAP